MSAQRSGAFPGRQMAISADVSTPIDDTKGGTFSWGKFQQDKKDRRYLMNLHKFQQDKCYMSRYQSQNKFQ